MRNLIFILAYFGAIMAAFGQTTPDARVLLDQSGASSGQVLYWNGSKWVPGNASAIAGYTNLYLGDGVIPNGDPRNIELDDNLSITESGGLSAFSAEAGDGVSEIGGLIVSPNESKLTFTSGSDVSTILADATGINIETSGSKSLGIVTNSMSLAKNTTGLLDISVNSHTGFLVDSITEFYIGQFPAFPDVNYDGTDKGFVYSPGYNGFVGIFNGNGVSGDYSSLEINENVISFVARDQSSTTANVQTNMVFGGNAKRTQINLTSTGITNPLGANRIWQHFNDTLNYIALGHSLSSSPAQQAAFFVVGKGGNSGSFLDRSIKRKIGVETYKSGNNNPYLWWEVEIPASQTDTTGHYVKMYNGSYALANARPSYVSGQKRVMLWEGTGTYATPSFVDPATFGGGSGNGIYGDGSAGSGSDDLPTGGSEITQTAIGNTLRYVSSTGNTTTRDMLRLNVVNDAFTRYLTMTAPTDSFKIMRSASQNQTILQSYSSALAISSDSVIVFSADSLKAIEGTIQTETKIPYIAGYTTGNIFKRLEGTVTGQVPVWNETGGYWEAGTVAGGSGDITNGGNTTGAAVIIGTNDNNRLALEVNNVERISLNTDYSITTTATVSNTNTAFDQLIIRNNSTGTAANGFGTGLAFYGESSTTDNRFMGSFATTWSNAADGAQTSNFGIYISNAGSAAQGFTVFGSANPYATFGSGTTQYANAGITPGTAYIIGGNAQTVTVGGSNGTVNLGNSNGTVNMGGASSTGTLNVFTAATTTNAINIYTTANSGSSNAGVVIGNATNYIQTSGTRNYLNLNSGFAPTSGTAVHNSMAFTGTFNQTGGASGITRGIHMNQTITAVADFRALDIAVNNANAKGIYQTGASTENYLVGNTAFGSTTNPDDAVEITGNLELLVAGNKIKIATGSNASAGTATLSSGTVTVNTTAVTANSIIIPVLQNCSSCGTLHVSAKTAGTSFTITSANGADASTIGWLLIN